MTPLLALFLVELPTLIQGLPAWAAVLVVFFVYGLAKLSGLVKALSSAVSSWRSSQADEAQAEHERDFDLRGRMDELEAKVDEEIRLRREAEQERMRAQQRELRLERKFDTFVGLMLRLHNEERNENGKGNLVLDDLKDELPDWWTSQYAVDSGE